MKDRDVARNVLTKVFPQECQAIGPESVEDVLSGNVKVVAPEEGRPFPIMEVFDFLKEAAQFILSAYAIYKIIKDQGGGPKPTIREFKDAVSKEQPEQRRLTADQVEKILKEITKL
jgi:hypothetical protein